MRSESLPKRFGDYGGQYVPETLMPALAELEREWLAARDDPGFEHDLDVGARGAALPAEDRPRESLEEAVAVGFARARDRGGQIPHFVVGLAAG